MISTTNVIRHSSRASHVFLSKRHVTGPRARKMLHSHLLHSWREMVGFRRPTGTKPLVPFGTYPNIVKQKEVVPSMFQQKSTLRKCYTLVLIYNSAALHDNMLMNIADTLVWKYNTPLTFQVGNRITWPTESLNHCKKLAFEQSFRPLFEMAWASLKCHTFHQPPVFSKSAHFWCHSLHEIIPCSFLVLKQTHLRNEQCSKPQNAMNHEILIRFTGILISWLMKKSRHITG